MRNPGILTNTPDKQNAHIIPALPQKDPTITETERIMNAINFHRIRALASPTVTIIIAVKVVIGVTIVPTANILKISTAFAQPSPKNRSTSQSAVTNITAVINIVAIAIFVISDNAALRKRSGSSFILVKADCITFIIGGSS